MVDSEIADGFWQVRDFGSGCGAARGDKTPSWWQVTLMLPSIKSRLAGRGGLTTAGCAIFAGVAALSAVSVASQSSRAFAVCIRCNDAGAEVNEPG